MDGKARRISASISDAIYQRHVDWFLVDSSERLKASYAHVDEVEVTSKPIRPTDMPQLLDQCPEVLHNIFIYVDPLDLVNICLTCRFLNRFISGDDLLWKIQYLSRFVSATTMCLPALTLI